MLVLTTINIKFTIFLRLDLYVACPLRTGAGGIGVTAPSRMAGAGAGWTFPVGCMSITRHIMRISLLHWYLHTEPTPYLRMEGAPWADAQFWRKLFWRLDSLICYHAMLNYYVLANIFKTSKSNIFFIVILKKKSLTFRYFS